MPNPSRRSPGAHDVRGVTAWIAYIDRLREADLLLARGEWHGYLNDTRPPVLRGEYVLARWAAAPGGNGGSVLVAHDDPKRVIALAHRLEEALYVKNAPSALVQREEDR